MKTNYFVLQPIGKNGAIYDEDGDIIITPAIDSIFDKNGNEFYDHVFYIKSGYELNEYENFTDFASIVFEMGISYFDDLDEEVNEIFAKFMDIETDEPLFGIHIVYDDENDELTFFIVDLKMNRNAYECDGNCENCDINDDLYDEDDDFEDEYFFGFDW